MLVPLNKQCDYVVHLNKFPFLGIVIIKQKKAMSITDMAKPKPKIQGMGNIFFKYRCLLLFSLLTYEKSR